MLTLNNIYKNYITAGISTPALKGISLSFRRAEFVSILGPSGCGKTTLLNIIGGLDRYDSGDLIISNRSTELYTDKEWDSYRNHQIGFVFQNYNLIMHLNILDNVEMALTLAGLKKDERKKRAIEALERVGLKEHIYKKPNQLSGGQMQRVAIARAIVNNPQIILADEPTGALDTETSVQIMEILKELSKDRLIIMVTHNPELANKYSTRIVNLLDGVVQSDSMPYIPEVECNSPEDETTIQKTEKNEKTTAKNTQKTNKEKTSMSFFTALKLSLQNLLTKKARTILTSIAGSIGIIGVALILALSNGFQAYVDKMQMDTLSSYPLTIDRNETDLSSLEGALNNADDDKNYLKDKIYVNKLMEKLMSVQRNNNITDDYIENVIKKIDSSLYYDIQYKKNVQLTIYKQDGYSFRNANAVSNELLNSLSYDLWSEMASKKFLDMQYDLVAGTFPQDPTEENLDSEHEAVIVLNKNNQISDAILIALGFADIPTPSKPSTVKDSYEYDEIIGQEFKLINNDILYSPNTDENENIVSFTKNKITASIYNSGITLKIVGVLKLKDDNSMGSITGSIGYLPSLTNYVLEKEKTSQIVLWQQNEWNKKQEDENYDARSYDGDSIMDIEDFNSAMQKINGDESISSIRIYPVDFKSKTQIKSYLDKYNETVENEEDEVHYTDLMEIMVSTINTVISAISYILIAFTSISLVVSSLMIGIITYVSVLERIKEIGILRSIGARKKDISRVFNAETIIIGFCAGFIGVVFTFLASIPINAILYTLIDIQSIASLPILSAVLLITLSMGLTLIAGLIPAKIASNKDPVIALRSE